MLTLSTVSIALVPIRESTQRDIIFMIELPRIQTLSPTFTNSDIIAGLVYEHKIIDPMVMQKCDEKNTLLVFTESGNIKKYAIHCDPSRCGWVTM